MGLGAAYGEEVKPIIKKVSRITILEPSDAFSGHDEIDDVPCDYIKPNITGDIPLNDESIDLITCFGVMHHIPNVSHVMGECYRVLKNNGEMVIREPIVSMGDWRKPRKGLTKHERGIPKDIFNTIVKNAGFNITHATFCDFPVIPRLSRKLSIDAYNNKFFVIIDELLSKLFCWNIRYHRLTFF